MKLLTKNLKCFSQQFIQITFSSTVAIFILFGKTSAKTNDEICQEQSKKGYCGCREHPFCSFDRSTNKCFEKSDFCKRLTFLEGECANPGEHYAISGEVCPYNGTRQCPNSCASLQDYVAINFGGPTMISSTGTKFYSIDEHKPLTLQDPKNLNHKHQQPAYMLNGDKRDYDLYTTHLWVRFNFDGGSGQCSFLGIPVKENGYYYLRFKTIESSENYPNKRLFNVNFNNEPVLKELDIFANAGTHSHATDFIINFRVTNDGKTIYLPGFGEKEVAGDHPELQFCLSDCKVDKPYYVISAVHVYRLTNSIPGSGCEGDKPEEETTKSITTNISPKAGEDLKDTEPKSTDETSESNTTENPNMLSGLMGQSDGKSEDESNLEIIGKNKCESGDKQCKVSSGSSGPVEDFKEEDSQKEINNQTEASGTEVSTPTPERNPIIVIKAGRSFDEDD